MNANGGSWKMCRGAFQELCHLLALAGGTILLGVACFTVFSATGRYLFSQPVQGDTEIVALLIAAGVSLFLPYCQLNNGNVIVDFFTERASPRVRALLDVAASLLLAAAIGVLAWRMAVGGIELRRCADETMMLRIPTWWVFVVIVPCMALLSLAGIVTACDRMAAGKGPSS